MERRDARTDARLHTRMHEALIDRCTQASDPSKEPLPKATGGGWLPGPRCYQVPVQFPASTRQLRSGTHSQKSTRLHGSLPWQSPPPEAESLFHWLAEFRLPRPSSLSHTHRSHALAGWKLSQEGVGQASAGPCPCRLGIGWGAASGPRPLVPCLP